MTKKRKQAPLGAMEVAVVVSDLDKVINESLDHIEKTERAAEAMWADNPIYMVGIQYRMLNC